MVRPLDLQDNLSKTPYVDRVNQVKRQQPELDQRGFHLHLEQKVGEKQTTTQPSAQTDEVQIHQDKEQKGQEQKKDQQEEEKNSQEELKAEKRHKSDEVLGTVIDIVI